MGQTEDGDGGHKEGEGAALYDGKSAPQGHLQYSTVQYSTAQYSTPQGHLQQRDQPGHEENRGNDVSAGWVILPGHEVARL